MRLYELVVILRGSLSEVQRKKILERIKDWLKPASPSQGGEVKITKEEQWGQKPLAYKIKRELAGVYHLFHLEGEKGLSRDFEKKMVESEEIIRHLLIRKK